MKKIILYALFLTTFSGCGQKNKKNNMQETVTFTQQDMLNLYKTVRHFDEETHYGVRVKSHSINLQILINDREVFSTRKNKKGMVMNGAYAPINYGIFKAGEQQITIRMLPAVVDRKSEVKHPKLYGNAYLEVEIVADDFIDGESTGEYPIYEWTCPTEIKYVKNHGEVPVFIHPEAPYYEHTAVFEAEDVPYNIVGWENSIIIKPQSKEELQELTKEVVEVYEELRQLFINKELEKLADKTFNLIKMESQQLYFLKKDCNELWESYISPFKFIDFRMMSLENYELVVYGNGRLVGLELKGPKNEGASALWSRYNESTTDKKYTDTNLFYRFLLHRPTVNSKLEWI